MSDFRLGDRVTVRPLDRRVRESVGDGALGTVCKDLGDERYWVRLDRTGSTLGVGAVALTRIQEDGD